MKRLFYLFVIYCTFYACDNNYNKNKLPLQFVPHNSSAVIQVNEIKEFISSLEHHDILKSINNDNLKNASQLLKHLNTTNKVFVSFSQSSENNWNYLILTENDSALFVIDSIPNHTSEKLENFKINKTVIDTNTVYHTTSGNVFIASNSLDALKNLDDKTETIEYNKLLSTTNTKSIASLAFKANDPYYSKLLFSDFNNIEKTSNHVVLDIETADSNLQYNGIITSNDSSFIKLYGFKNTVPQKVSTINIAPQSTKSLYSVSFDDYVLLRQNLNRINNKTTDSTQTFLNFTNEIALIDDAIVLHTLDPNLAKESITDKNEVETYRSIDIYKFGDPNFFTSNLKPLIAYNNANYFAFYENFIVFSHSLEILKSVLADALNNNTLANSEAFNNIYEVLSDESSLFIYKNSEALSDFFTTSTKGYSANAVQYIYEDNYAHINGIIKKYKKRPASNSISEAFVTSLNAEIISPPQTLKNHRTSGYDIAVQDVNNMLYLISNSGSILWKKQVHGKILGKIEQIDMYKNGRLQLAFTTPNRLYVLDRNGNDVQPFPLKFKDKITQPLSVFDYDKMRNYRLLVSQDKDLLMYDVKGKLVNGFNYQTNKESIITQPKHFRIANKDYIVFAAGETLKILNRQGKIRIRVNDKINFSGNEIFLYQNKFTSTNSLGQLLQVDTRGKLQSKTINLPEKHHLETTSKTLVSMTDNQLNIKSRTIDLDYGDYTAPRIFYLNNKIYITTTDRQSKKVYLFDSQAKLIQNFPVFGISEAELQNLDNDNSLELITQSDSKNIIVYKIN